MNRDIQKFKNDLESCLNQTKLEQFSILMLHVRLKNLSEFYKLSYEVLTKNILETLTFKNPKNIIVPAFTYSFTKNKIFDLELSKSEVGVFSEIFRLKYSNHRTNDAIFSFCHLKNFEKEYKNINFKAAFIKNSIWEYFYKKNITIVNIGLDHLIISLIHYIEYICKVPYRKLFKIKGQVSLAKKNKPLSYDFYARDRNSIYGLDWEKIEEDLMRNSIIKKSKKNILNFKWIKVKELSDFVKFKIEENPYYLVKKNI